MPDEEELRQRKSTIFYARTISSIIFASLNIIMGAVATIYIGVVWSSIINDNNASCSLKAAFSFFCLAIGGHGLILGLDIAYACYLLDRQHCCTCQCFTLKYFSHVISSIIILLGIIIFAAKDQDKISWSFYVMLANFFISLINAGIYIGTEQMKRYLQSKNVRVSVLELGKKIDE